jgi:hypothetical protein
MTADSRTQRDRQRDLEARADRARIERTPALRTLTCQVYNAGAMPSAPMHYFAVHPVLLSGAELEAGALASSVLSNAQELVLVLGPGAPQAGDILWAVQVGDRWVAQLGTRQSGDHPPIHIPDCPCVDTPATVNMTVSNCGPDLVFNGQSCTITWGPLPAVYGSILPSPCFLSTQVFYDSSIGSNYQWNLQCQQYAGRYSLNRAYQDYFGLGPLLDSGRALYTVGSAGNTCVPWLMSNPVLYPGYSGPPCTVALSG